MRVLAPGWLHVDGDRIVEVGEGAPPREPDVDLGGASVVPGFVDLHVHGGGGASFDLGTADAAAVVADTHLAHGTTSMAASLVTDTPQQMADAVRELALLVQDGRLSGIHLEGPWLSPQRSGAHQPGSLTHPEPAAVQALLAAGDGAVRMVTLAPELPGGIEAVRQLADAGVVAAIGHTDAMAAAGAPDGDYRLGPMAIEVRDGVARLADGNGTGAIAGSTLTMDAAVRFAVRTAGLPLLDVVHAASTAPARAWGLDDVGALEAGRRADLVVLDEGLHVVRTMRAGAWVNPSSTPA